MKKKQYWHPGVGYVMKLLEKIYYQLPLIQKEYLLYLFRYKINLNTNSRIHIVKNDFILIGKLQ